MSTEKGSEAGMTLGCVMVVAIISYGLVQAWAGYIGLEHQWGHGWAIAGIIVAVMLRFSLPITIGAFLGAWKVWGWPWYGALAFASPGLLFMALMLPGAAISDFMNRK